jgi:chemotaxis protein MotB
MGSAQNVETTRPRMAKKKADAHHGGAWKVAYADFVTAMMALFMVLWICSQDKKIMLATSRYFKQPFNSITDRSVGIMPGKDGGSVGKEQSEDHSTAANLNFLNALASELGRMLAVSDMQEKVADVQVTSDGLRVTLFDRNKHPIFQKGNAQMTEFGQLMMQNLAWIIERNGLKVFIDGHSAKPEVGEKLADGYDAWALTSDRANAARRLLEKYAVDSRKFERITGYGDTKPLRGQAPESENNDRIVLSLSAHR